MRQPYYSTAGVVFAVISSCFIGLVLGYAWAVRELPSLYKWQTLLSAFVAVGAAYIAWLNVRKQLSINLMSREEDRIERALPGIRQALEVMSPLLNDLRALKHKELAPQLVEPLASDNVNESVKRLVPLADEHLRKEVRDILFLLTISAKEAFHAHDEMEGAGLAVRMINEYAPEEHDKLHNALDAAKADFNARADKINRDTDTLEQFISKLNDRANTHVLRLEKIRRIIEQFFETT
jgi:hypothetical protein